MESWGGGEGFIACGYSWPHLIFLGKNAGQSGEQTLAGTRRCGKTDKEDRLMEQELLADEKECAEHVELGQNDMGKVRRFQ